MATDLQKIISISGESGLFQYLSQGKNSVIAESIVTKKRTSYGLNARVTSLADISIYTEDGEIILKDLFIKMKEKLGDAAAPDHKSDPKVLVAFFEEVLPTYDRDKFYASHMKKVVQWYNLLREYASLDFVDHDASGDAAETKVEEVKTPSKSKKAQSEKNVAMPKAPKGGASKAKAASLPRKSGNS